jgi:transcriptional regulator with XRE-family HTH domain
LEADAWEIRKRAEDRLGELSAELPKAKGGSTRPTSGTSGTAKHKALKIAGISKSAASRYERFHRLPSAEKERRIARGRAAIEAGRSIADSIAREGDKAERRAERERELAVKVMALPSEKCAVVHEDYEWNFEVRSRETGMDRHAANHYPVGEDAHTAEEIVERTCRGRALAVGVERIFARWPWP